MCLGIPGEVVRWIDRDPLMARAAIRFGDLERVCHLACVPEAEVGDFVIVHAGIAISKVNAEEAVNMPLPNNKVQSLRASYYMMGAMLSRFKKCVIGLPGGCPLGPRPIARVLEEMKLVLHAR